MSIDTEVRFNEILDFSFIDFILEERREILIFSFFIFSVDLFLYGKGNKLLDIVTINLGSILLYLVCKFIKYRERKAHLKKLLSMVEKLDKKHLIAECIKETESIDDEFYLKILRLAGKSMLEEISKIKRDRLSYKEYIERWVHEIKTPISVLSLSFDNRKDDFSIECKNELTSIEGYVEQALFYARSENVEKDYFIKEVNISECINKIIIKNKIAFILNNVSLDIKMLDYTVYSDEKWIDFIISQVINNSIKYKSANAILNICAREEKDRLVLMIKDNGIGIKECDLDRVFEKGFTGSDKRNDKNSTGIGLYLSKKLCDKLGLLIDIKSKVNKFTEISIIFPKGNFSNNDMFKE